MYTHGKPETQQDKATHTQHANTHTQTHIHTHTISNQKNGMQAGLEPTTQHILILTPETLELKPTLEDALSVWLPPSTSSSPLSGTSTDMVTERDLHTHTHTLARLYEGVH